MNTNPSASMPVAGAMPDTTQLGGAPRDGDFARLLDAASQPSAHRLHRSLTTSLPAPRQAITMLEPLADGTHTARRGTSAPMAVHEPSAPPSERTGSPLPGSAAPLELGATALKRWSQKSPRDRFVSALFVLAAIWIGMAILGQLMSQFEDHAGLLIILGIGAFLYFTGRARRRGQRS